MPVSAERRRKRADSSQPHSNAFGFADQDPSMTAEQIAEFERTLDNPGARYRAEVYEGAHHGYTMADTAAYDEAARERHFRELHDLLERTLARSSA